MAEVIDAKLRFRPAPVLREVATEPAPPSPDKSGPSSRAKLYSEIDALHRGLSREEN
ncbi:hypothetical protein IVA86_33150 [Bradyrhizobium sp. 146]|uniref:hypothetical protein n=1 Tax=Bradyrhizobium sp. 146 TaxID=2782622 RepID=UPI001FFAEDA6|nr:hypothetical protein [Bradyrhizobium sp. 146]MCK1706121.1 hypothetical protein [Bradyrhizobium sp. 146]